MKAIILCGGKAERLGDITKTTPKSMLMFNGKPLLWYQIMWLKKYYVTDIILCVGHLSQSIRNYFGNGKDLGVRIRYSVETEPLGTGGAIYAAFKFCDKDRPVMVLNGDVYGTFNIFDMIYTFYRKTMKGDTIIVGKQMVNCSDYGTLRIIKNNRIESFHEKNNIPNQFINTGVYMFYPMNMPKIQTMPISIEKDIFPILGNKTNLVMYRARYENDFWIDCGTPERLRLLERYMGGK